MENWLKNKTVLHSLLQQSDYANTINGGISQTYFHTETQEDKVVISVFAAGVKSSDFKIALNNNNLIVSRHLNESFGERGIERLLVPSFIKAFELPYGILREGIEAFYEDGVLRIVLPIQNKQDLNREIKIQEL